MDRGTYRGCCGGEVSEEGWEVVDVGVDLERIELRWREARALSGVCVPSEMRSIYLQRQSLPPGYRRFPGPVASHYLYASSHPRLAVAVRRRPLPSLKLPRVSKVIVDEVSTERVLGGLALDKEAFVLSYMLCTTMVFSSTAVYLLGTQESSCRAAASRRGDLRAAT